MMRSASGGAVETAESVSVALLYGGHDAVGQRRQAARHARHARADRLAHVVQVGRAHAEGARPPRPRARALAPEVLGGRDAVAALEPRQVGVALPAGVLQRHVVNSSIANIFIVILNTSNEGKRSLLHPQKYLYHLNLFFYHKSK